MENRASPEVHYGFPAAVFRHLITEYHIAGVYTNTDYEPYATERDGAVQQLLKEEGIPFRSYKGESFPSAVVRAELLRNYEKRRDLPGVKGTSGMGVHLRMGTVRYPLDWQWAAGCGCDAAPYFRVFNPSLQAKRFDPDGSYIRRWVP